MSILICAIAFVIIILIPAYFINSIDDNANGNIKEEEKSIKDVANPFDRMKIKSVVRTDINWEDENNG